MSICPLRGQVNMTEMTGIRSWTERSWSPYPYNVSSTFLRLIAWECGRTPTNGRRRLRMGDVRTVIADIVTYLWSTIVRALSITDLPPVPNRCQSTSCTQSLIIDVFPSSGEEWTTRTIVLTKAKNEQLPELYSTSRILGETEPEF